MNTETLPSLTPDQSLRLSQLEDTIQKGIATFREVGEAIQEIRDSRLYRLSHPSFEIYCQERWQISRSRAYQLIESSEIATQVSTVVDISEAQSRALLKIPTQKRLPMIKKILKAGPLTTEALQDASKPPQPKPEPTPKTTPTTFTLDDLDIWWNQYKTILAYQSSPSIPKALQDLRQFLQKPKSPKRPN